MNVQSMICEVEDLISEGVNLRSVDESTGFKCIGWSSQGTDLVHNESGEHFTVYGEHVEHMSEFPEMVLEQEM